MRGPLLLIMGLGAPMTAWRPEFRAALVERGFRIVSFDNRDAGLSAQLDEVGVPDLMGALSGSATAPYLLSDMAADALAVLDAERITAAGMGHDLPPARYAEVADAVASLAGLRPR